jgi:hypothetical protein
MIYVILINKLVFLKKNKYDMEERDDRIEKECCRLDALKGKYKINRLHSVEPQYSDKRWSIGKGGTVVL